VAKALYSIPGGLSGQRVDVRADRQLVKVSTTACWPRPILARRRRPLHRLWAKRCQVYALPGIVKKWGAERVDAVCARAAEAERASA
jgi:hypothetical protein